MQFGNPTCQGSRSELVSLLRKMAEGWYHLAKDKLSADATAGAYRLASGDASVRVGHTLYEVTDA